MSSLVETVPVGVLKRLLERERFARKEAEQLLDSKSMELYDANLQLRKLADELEARVSARTVELEQERNRAIEVAEALRQSQIRYNDVASMVGEYLWELDADFCFKSVTSQIEAVTGYGKDELIGRSIFDIMYTEDACELRSTMESSVKEERVFTNLTHRVLAKSGDIVWQQSSGRPRFDSHFRFFGFNGASLDVTEQERAKIEMQQLVVALEHAGDGISITNTSGLLSFSNLAFVEMFGYSNSQTILGMPWTSFLVDDDVRRIAVHLNNVHEEALDYSCEGRGARLDGSVFFGHFSINRLPNGNLLWICRDESERLNTLLNLQTQNSQLAALIENIQIGVIFEGNSAGTLIYNQIACSLLGIEQEVFDNSRVVASLLKKLADVSTDSECQEGIAQLLHLNGAANNVQVRFDEERIYVFDRVPVYVGNIYRGALWTIRDISEEKRQSAVLEEAREQAEAGALAKSTFLANMSHEIRTPLNGICGMARLLKHEPLNEAGEEYLHAIQSSADILLHVLNDILDFSKVDAQQLDIEVIEFDLAHLLDSIFSILRSQAAEAGLRFDFIYPDAKLPKLYGDPGRLSEVLLNLLGNALKFTSEGSVLLSVRVVSKQAGELKLKLSVVDTGIGMSSDELSRVFQPFSQADCSISRRFGGTGLGLTICRDLIRLMEGSLSVESEPNLGTIFTVEMPYDFKERVEEQAYSEFEEATRIVVLSSSDVFFNSVKSILAYAGIHVKRAKVVDQVRTFLDTSGAGKTLVITDQVDASSHDAQMQSFVDFEMDAVNQMIVSRGHSEALGQSDRIEVVKYPFSRYQLLRAVHSILNLKLPAEIFQKHEWTSAEGIDLSGLNILLAEDNVVNQKVGRITIEGFGAQVDVAANGLEVLELLDRFDYDLILMDIRMPEMDGVEACKRVRAMGLTIPIYALTADAMKGDRERFVSAGMDGYLSKPLVEKELVQLLLNTRHGLLVQGDVIDSNHVINDTAQVNTSERFFEEGLVAVVLDIDDFKELIGGDLSFVVSILDVFVDTAKVDLSEAKAALQISDYDAARSRFHKLAGSCASICAWQLRSFALSCERYLIDAEECVVEEIQPQLIAIDTAFPRLIAEIKNVVREEG
jgi:PAS domain S-box-containing protein